MYRWIQSASDFYELGKMKVYPTLIKKKIKFPSYMRKFRVEQLQRKGFLIHEEMRRYFP